MTAVPPSSRPDSAPAPPPLANVPSPAPANDPALERLALGILFLVLGLVAALTPAQNDTFWHLRAGADIWRTHQFLHVDTYSHTVAGAPWENHEWLAQVLMYLAWRMGGMPALSAAATLLIMVTVAITYRLMVGPPLVRCALLAVGMSIASCVWVLRPQLATLLGIAVLLLLLVQERHRLIPPLFVLWANAHGAVALGGIILLAAAVATLLCWHRTRDLADRKRLVTFALVLPLAALATAATPLGFHIFSFVMRLGGPFSEHVTEWSPPLPFEGLGTLFWLAVVGFVGVLLARRRALRALDWPALTCLLPAAALFPLAAQSMRNIGPFLMVATVAASRVLGPGCQLRFRSRFRFPARWRSLPSADTGARGRLRCVTAIVGGLAVAGLGFAVYAWNTELAPLNYRPIGDDALSAVRACDGPLYNRYDDGGYLIWFAPEKPVFVDGRQVPYSLDLLNDVVTIENGGSYRAAFTRWGIRCAFLPVHDPLASRLHDDGWRVTFADARWTVLGSPPL
ncbi:MAG: hypothetical protein ABI560_10680 [Myxococcales bacterium]